MHVVELTRFHKYHFHSTKAIDAYMFVVHVTVAIQVSNEARGACRASDVGGFPPSKDGYCS